MTNVCEHGQLKRSCQLCEKDEEIMTLEQALQWAARNCVPEAVGRLRSREVVATLVDEIASLRQQLDFGKHLYIEMQERLVEVEKEKDTLATISGISLENAEHRQALQAWASGLKEQLAACEKERDELLHIADGIKARRMLRGFYVPQDVGDLIAAIDDVIRSQK